MKNAIKKAIRILLALIQAIFDLFKTVVLKSLLYAFITIIATVLIPFIPFILWIYFAYQLKLEKLEKSTSQPQRLRKAVKRQMINKFNYEKTTENIKTSTDSK